MLAVCLALSVPGCAMSGGQEGRVQPVQYLADGPPLATNISYVRSTALHRWTDGGVPAPFGAIQVMQLQVIVREKPKVYVAPEKGSALYPFLVQDEHAANLILAPGYNPVRMGDLEPQMLDAITGADSAFAKEYAYDLNHPRPNRFVRFDREQGLSIIAWTRLPQNSDDLRKGVQVDHGFLIYLLQEDSLWEGVRRAAGKDQNRQAVRLVCQAVLDLMKAHDLEWPAFPWNDKQEAIRSWCEKTPITAEK